MAELVGDRIKAAYPEASGEWDVAHLPNDLERDWAEATKVYRVRAYSAAVVMCGRTLEPVHTRKGVEDHED